MHTVQHVIKSISMDILISPLEIGINDKQLSFCDYCTVRGLLFICSKGLIFIDAGLNGKKIDG